MTRASIAMFSLMVGLAACGDDDGSGSGGSGSSTGMPNGSSDTNTAPTTEDPPSTTDGGESTSTSGPPPADSTGSTGSDTEPDTDTAGIDCDAIAPGPLAVEMVFPAGNPFSGAEDIAFDGQGHVAGKASGEVRLVSPDGTTVDSWPDSGPAWGLRFRGNGDLLAAKFQLGQIRVVTSGNAVLVDNLASINGLYPDFDDNVWFTDGETVQRYNADGTTDSIVSGANALGSNGVVWDPDRSLLFYTLYGSAQIRSVEIAGDGSPGAISTLGSVGGGGALDGLSMDACGNLYVVDQANSRLYRLFLDGAGEAIGTPELLVDSFPTNVANAVFGSGDGWDPNSVYASGSPGGVYRVEIGVPGAPYPTL